MHVSQIMKGMDMRDHLKNVEYFNQFIYEDSERIKKFSSKLESGEVKAERIFPVKSKVHDLKLGILIAKYSRGDELAELKKEYFELASGWEEVWEPEYYNKNLKMVSLGVLFGADKDFAKKVKDMLEKSEIYDGLLYYLLDALGDEPIEERKEMLFPKSFSNLQKVVYQENKLQALKKYLSDDWYNEDCGCYEAHKSKQNIYYGYWSFEAGAIAKILNLDDSSLKDVSYYPYDLAHYSMQ